MHIWPPLETGFAQHCQAVEPHPAPLGHGAMGFVSRMGMILSELNSLGLNNWRGKNTCANEIMVLIT